MAIDPDALKTDIVANFATEYGEIQPRGLEGLELAAKAMADAIAAAHNADASGGGDPNVLWRWNGVDLSQWRTTAAEVDTTGGAVLSLSSLRGQPNLRFRAGGAFGFAQWVVDPAEFPSGIPARFVLEIIYDEFDNGSGTKNPSSTACGVSLFCRYNSPGNVRAWTLAQNGNGNFQLQIYTRDTTFSNPGATPTGEEPGAGANRGAYHQLIVTQEVGTPFDMFYFGRFQGQNAEQIQNRSGNPGGIDFDGGAYDGIIPNTIGVAFRDNVGQTSWCEISSIRMLKHPADV